MSVRLCKCLWMWMLLLEWNLSEVRIGAAARVAAAGAVRLVGNSRGVVRRQEASRRRHIVKFTVHRVVVRSFVRSISRYNFKFNRRLQYIYSVYTCLCIAVCDLLSYLFACFFCLDANRYIYIYICVCRLGNRKFVTCCFYSCFDVRRLIDCLIVCYTSIPRVSTINNIYIKTNYIYILQIIAVYKFYVDARANKSHGPKETNRTTKTRAKQ